jgi:hypothetical protein
MKKYLAILLFYTSIGWAMNYIKIAENENMVIYIDVDSIKKSGEIVKLKEIVDFKKPYLNKDGIEYSSHLIEQTINCKTREQTLDFVTIYTGKMLQGRILEKGLVPNSKRVIPESSLSYQTYKFVCGKLD